MTAGYMCDHGLDATHHHVKKADWRTSIPWLKLEEVELYIEQEVQGSELDELLGSTEFAAAFQLARRRRRHYHVEVPVVRQSGWSVPRGRAITFGSPCDWKDGIAKRVLQGSLSVLTIVFCMRGKGTVEAQSRNLMVCSLSEDTARPTKNLRLGPRSYSQGKTLCYGAFACKGDFRAHMEDRHIAVQDLLRYRKRPLRRSADSAQEIWYWGVYDGHNGQEIAEALQQKLHLELAESEHFPENLANALKLAYLSLDQKLTQVALKPENTWASGSTAISVVIQGNKLFIANAGDCRAVLCRSGKAIALTTDHRPDLLSEAERVNKAGGFIISGYVGDAVGVTRAFGDVDHKYFRKLKGLTAEPETVERVLDEEDEFLVVACDGLWDGFPGANGSQKAIDVVRSSLRRSLDPSVACRDIAERAMMKNNDNITVVVISFHRREGFVWDTVEEGLSSSARVRPQLSRAGLSMLKSILAP